MLERRYTALPIFISILRILGAVPTLFGLFLVGGLLTSLSDMTKPLPGTYQPLVTAIIVGIAIAPLLLGLALFAGAELLKVVMDIEENTRRAADDSVLAAAAARRS